MSQKAKFVVGGTIVTAHIPEHEDLAETTRLQIVSSEDSWYTTEMQLEESYTPISETAEHWYETVVDDRVQNS